jgi:hypothetical protein
MTQLMKILAGSILCEYFSLRQKKKTNDFVMMLPCPSQKDEREKNITQAAKSVK